MCRHDRWRLGGCVVGRRTLFNANERFWLTSPRSLQAAISAKGENELDKMSVPSD